jgi:hypothetical protein
MPSIVIKGRSNYINRLYAHLRKEHPSTKQRMKRRK